MFTTTSFLKKKLRGLSLKAINAIENNGNCNFESNGEKLFVDNLFYLFKRSGGRKVVFDIGANVGNYSKMINDRALGSNVDIDLHIFEPTKSCFVRIAERFKNDNFTLNNFGVSDDDGIATIYYDKEGSGLASLYQRNLDSYHLELGQREEVALRRLDDYIEEKMIPHIDFIKIDIEGHELKAFQGFGKYFRNDFIDYVQFEYGGANLDSHVSLMELYNFFSDRNFKIAKILPNGLELRDYRPWMENFVYSNYVAISDKVLMK